MNKYDIELVNEAIDSLIKDISDRRGLRHEWEQIDDDVVVEIREKWFDILSPLVMAHVPFAG
jgi:hypothetical protein